YHRDGRHRDIPPSRAGGTRAGNCRTRGRSNHNGGRDRVRSREVFVISGHSHTIWIKTLPEGHISPGMAHDDFRPMAHNREAMADLVAILDARGPDYARAQAQLDPSGENMEQSFAKLLRIVPQMLGPALGDHRAAGGVRPWRLPSPAFSYRPRLRPHTPSSRPPPP